MLPESSISRRLQSLRYGCAPLVVLCFLGFFFATTSRAQDVAAATRQTHAEKNKDKNQKPAHVYTDDDLKRTHILTPDDQAKVEARKRNSEPPAAAPREKTLDAGTPAKTESLGEVARRYRQEKAAREAEQALKKQPRDGFPMALPGTSLAAPKPLVVPGSELHSPAIPRRKNFAARAPLKIIPTAPRSLPSSNFSLPSSPAAPEIFRMPNSLPNGGASRGRISPFQPRPLGAPVTRSNSATSSLPPINPAKLQRVTVKRGDTFWKFARIYLGQGSRWQELLSVNPGMNDPRTLEAGAEIFVPRNAMIATPADAPKKFTPRDASGTITVHLHDSLWSIARRNFGHGAAWTCVAQANPQIADPNFLLPGEQLLLPAGCRELP